jgi:hypothetical protein
MLSTLFFSFYEFILYLWRFFFARSTISSIGVSKLSLTILPHSAVGSWNSLPKILKSVLLKLLLLKFLSTLVYSSFLKLINGTSLCFFEGDLKIGKLKIARKCNSNSLKFVFLPKLPFRYHVGEGKVLRSKRRHQLRKILPKSPAPPNVSVTFQPCLVLQISLYLIFWQVASFPDNHHVLDGGQ